MKQTIYAIYDNKAEDFIGAPQALVTFKHDAAAIRFFTDLALDKNTVLARHPEDYELIALATMENTGIELLPARTVITGAAWAAAQEAKS